MRRVRPPTHTPPAPQSQSHAQSQPPALPTAGTPAPSPPATPDRTGPLLMVVTVSAGACAVLWSLALVLDAVGHAAGAIAAIPTGGVLTGIAVQLLRRRS
ncbi:hypothetical protein J7F03_06095 [Streptomyces sp. ISL-43]|uniref:hypothetical protein n=1 Tax=Streptomyces sp. ISL-43 TaxID=2819183 RepID=UPI001BE77C48|nr:hypothetical protein [Streptomyces sp. ISL-43]MBT2446656.1 hypothetical protein [Streptomyces sp. ISL-43]